MYVLSISYNYLTCFVNLAEGKTLKARGATYPFKHKLYFITVCLSFYILNTIINILSSFYTVEVTV